MNSEFSLQSDAPQASIPGLDSDSPRAQGPVPGLDSDSPRAQGPVPGLDSDSPRAQVPVPGLDSDSPRAQGPVPGLDSDSPRTQGPVPGLDSDSPRAQGPVPGLLYFAFIPPGLKPKYLRHMMSDFGEVGRVFIQETDQRQQHHHRHGGRGSWGKKKAWRRGRGFTEGWVEFRDKAVAKTVARSLHNTPIGTRKRSRFHDDLWNIKYLHRFKWTHLSERLAYEKLVSRQRMRAEVSQAKRETNFFFQNVEKSKGLEKLQEMKKKKGQEWQEKNWHFQQRATEAEIQASKEAGRRSKARELGKAAEFHRKSQSNVTLLAKIFNPTTAQE